MRTRCSEISLDEALRKILAFNPIKIYYNKKLVWDDDKLDIENWVLLEESMNMLKKLCLPYNKIIITDIKIKIVEHHHSIVYLKGIYNK